MKVSRKFQGYSESLNLFSRFHYYHPRKKFFVAERRNEDQPIKLTFYITKTLVHNGISAFNRDLFQELLRNFSCVVKILPLACNSITIAGR